MNNKKNVCQYCKILTNIGISIAQFSFVLSLSWKFGQYFTEYKMNYINIWMLLFKIITIMLLFNILLSLKKIVYRLIKFICKYLEISN